MPEISFTLNGTAVVVADDGCSLLEALRDRLGVRSAKDGCSPQGQCGCCTVWVDGSPRVSCVTPIGRVRDRAVTTLEGLSSEVRSLWGESLCATGGSQCGFCTPGIIMRLEGLRCSRGELSAQQVDQALLAHLCRCTGWQTIREAAERISVNAPTSRTERELTAAAHRALIEGASVQMVGPEVALGHVPFADDTAPAGALVAVRGRQGEWSVAETLTEARRLAGKVQGRNTTEPLSWPIEPPEGEWDRVLQTTWVEPGYLEPDATWCAPGGEPASPLANGGAFGAKGASPVGEIARRLADEHGRAVRVLYSREDVVRLGPKRPPMALGMRRDGTGIARVARTPGIVDAIRSVAPRVEVVEVEIAGPPTSSAIRAAGWAEVLAVFASFGDIDEVRTPAGAVARVTLDDDGTVRVRVDAGRVLDETVLRSYCIGAAHMALGWVRSEGIVVDSSGEPLDLTIRSFGILRSADVPHIEVELVDSDRPAVNASSAVFAAVAAAAWRHAGHVTRWPVGITQ